LEESGYEKAGYAIRFKPVSSKIDTPALHPAPWRAFGETPFTGKQQSELVNLADTRLGRNSSQYDLHLSPEAIAANPTAISAIHFFPSQQCAAIRPCP
jgi:hypothetical protein